MAVADLPLPFAWPDGLLFMVVVGWAAWPEWPLSRRSRSTIGAQDRGSTMLIRVGARVGALAAIALAVTVPSAAMPAPRVLFLFGLTAIVAGSLLRRHCMRMLGPSFTGSVRVLPGQTIVSRGAYRWIRHPAYSAVVLTYVGIGLALGNWASLVTLVVAWAAIYSYRASVEERALPTTLGEPYRLYRQRTKRFVPFVL